MEQFRMNDGFEENQAEIGEIQKVKFVYFDMTNPKEPIHIFDCEVTGGIDEADEAYEAYTGRNYMTETKNIARTIEE